MFVITGCRVSAVVNAIVGDLEHDGVEHYVHVTEKRNKKKRKILLDAARAVLSCVERADTEQYKEGPLLPACQPFQRFHSPSCVPLLGPCLSSQISSLALVMNSGGKSSPRQLRNRFL